MLADALDPSKKGVGAAQAGGCLGDLMPKAIERCTDHGKIGRNSAGKFGKCRRWRVHPKKLGVHQDPVGGDWKIFYDFPETVGNEKSSQLTFSA